MVTMNLKLLTIVAEAVLEDRIVRDLRAAGVTGHTVTSAHGSGSRGVRAGSVGGGNVRIETVLRPALADQFLEVLAERYFPHYAVIAWTSDVSVLRGGKFA
jgi:nitrogen regulatory protein P-II 2